MGPKALALAREAYSGIGMFSNEHRAVSRGTQTHMVTWQAFTNLHYISKTTLIGPPRISPASP
jgi:hypothetical protein